MLIMLIPYAADRRTISTRVNFLKRTNCEKTYITTYCATSRRSWAELEYMPSLLSTSETTK